MADIFCCRYECCPEPYVNLNFKFSLRRKYVVDPNLGRTFLFTLSLFVIQNYDSCHLIGSLVCVPCCSIQFFNIICIYFTLIEQWRLERIVVAIGVLQLSYFKCSRAPTHQRYVIGVQFNGIFFAPSNFCADRESCQSGSTKKLWRQSLKIW